MPPRASTQERSLRRLESAFPRRLGSIASDRTRLLRPVRIELPWPARIKAGAGTADLFPGREEQPVDELAQARSALEEDRVLMSATPGAGHAGEAPASCVVILPEARADDRGVLYRRGGRLFLLPWSRVEAAHAAEVGEAEGVQTVVFDLALAGRPRALCRLDADPGEAARALGQAVERGLGRKRCSASLRAVALEGYATRSYPDVESFERDAPREFLRSA
jgi:hypothetical protein